jgi:predicted nucleic-acid-binding Zn-ribbon protein
LAFTEDEKQKLLAAIQARVPSIRNCPVCGNNNWTLANGYVQLPLQKEIGSTVLGGPVLPCVPIICTNCGNTVLLNAFILGLKDILEKKPGA